MNTVTLEDIPYLWRAESLASTKSDAIATGYAALDHALGGGWPRPSLIELMHEHHGIGELRLLLGLLRQSQLPSGPQNKLASKVTLWLSPPFQLHAIALDQYGLATSDHWVCNVPTPADLAWGMTHALRSGACHTVVAWVGHLKRVHLQSLKLAALTGGSVGVLFRPLSFTRVASPATLRLALQFHEQGLEVSVLKMQGRRPCVIQIAPGEADLTTKAG